MKTLRSPPLVYSIPLRSWLVQRATCVSWKWKTTFETAVTPISKHWNKNAEWNIFSAFYFHAPSRRFGAYIYWKISIYTWAELLILVVFLPIRLEPVQRPPIDSVLKEKARIHIYIELFMHSDIALYVSYKRLIFD